MENNRLYEILNRYFNRLSQVGYISDNATFSVLVMSYITDIKNHFSLTKEEEYIIDRAIECIQGSCLIPYESCKGNCI